jgi:hypothetical protein
MHIELWHVLHPKRQFAKMCLVMHGTRRQPGFPRGASARFLPYAEANVTNDLPAESLLQIPQNVDL